LKQNSIKALSIQIHLSGLSFCILNRSNSAFEFITHVQLEKKGTPYELLYELKKTIEAHTELQQVFDSVTCIYQNELSCLVPKELFDEHNLADYLKFNAKILRTDFISYDTLATNDIMNVYVPLVNINNYIFETFGTFDYKHSSTILIETLLQIAPENDTTALYVNVNGTSFEIIGIKDKSLVFHNTFDYATKEDFIYYILFTLEQLKLNPETIKTVLTGGITKDDELFEIIYKYIRFVEFIKPNYNYTLTKDLDTNYSDFILINSFS
jgi:hypothetical protein